MALETFEFLREHVDETLCGLGESRLVLPSLHWVEDVRLDARDRGRHGETEIGIASKIGAVEGAVESGREQPAGDANWHAPAGPVLAARPSGIDEPAIDRVLGDQVPEEVAVDRGMARHE